MKGLVPIPKDAFKRALVADDDKIIRRYVADMLRPMLPGGAEVLEAHSGERAMELLRQTPAAYLITDMRMAHMDGTELIRQAKEACPWLQVIALSNYDDFDYVKPSFLYGIVDYVLKMRLTAEAMAEKMDTAKANLAEYAARQAREAGERRAARLNDCRAIGERYEAVLRAALAPDRVFSAGKDVAAVYLRADAIPESDAPASPESWCQALSLRWIDILEQSKGSDPPKSGALTPLSGNGVWQFLLPARADAARVRFGAAFHSSARNPRSLAMALEELYGRMHDAACAMGGIARIAWQEGAFSYNMVAALEERVDLLFYQNGYCNRQAEPIGSAAAISPPEHMKPSVRLLAPDGTLGAFADALARGDRMAALSSLREAAARLQNDPPPARTGLRILEHYRNALERLAGVGVPAFGDPDKLRRMAHLLAALEAAVTGDWQCADSQILADTDCERVRALIRQVEENPSMSLSLSEAAARTGFSVPHFCRLFKAATGGSWGAFVTRTRIARAQTLLKLPGAQVKRVAAAVGIEDAGYFRKVFFKQTGTTVEEFLRGQGGGQ